MEHEQAGRFAQTIAYLRDLDDPQLLKLLEHVFAGRSAYPEEDEWHQTHYFLGLASRGRDDDPAVDLTPIWEPWKVYAIAYVDRDRNPRGEGFWRFCEEGVCTHCRTPTLASLKHAVCSVCGAKVYGT